MRNSLQLDFVRSAFAYSAFAAAFFFVMTVVAFGQTTLLVPTVSGCALKTNAEIDVIERNSSQTRLLAPAFDLAHPAKLCSLAGPGGGLMDGSWWMYFFVGVLAQAVDGALGMAFGVTATTVMLSFGTSPAQASAMVHIAEIFTTAASGASHWWHRNVDWTMVKRIAIPGVIGGVIGATVLANVDGKNHSAIRHGRISAIIGIVILIRAWRPLRPHPATERAMPVVGFFGGLLDAIGGGGWGPVVTSTLVGAGQTPRYVIGSVNLTEFLVTVATSVTLIVSLGVADLAPVIPLVLGGLVTAPFAGYLVKIVPTRALMVAVGILILLLSLRSLVRALGWM